MARKREIALSGPTIRATDEWAARIEGFVAQSYLKVYKSEEAAVAAFAETLTNS